VWLTTFILRSNNLHRLFSIREPSAPASLRRATPGKQSGGSNLGGWAATGTLTIEPVALLTDAIEIKLVILVLVIY
jgi:hypothetical protein